MRLPDFDYASPWIVYHVTIRSKEKKRIFRSSSINEKVVGVLKSSVDLYGYHLLSYCLMPDHLHILVQAGESPKNLESFVRGFKSYSSKLAKQHLWQRGFYDRILRKEESLADVAQYILDNPVRKGIVEDSEQFKWCELLVENFGNDSRQKRPSSRE